MSEQLVSAVEQSFFQKYLTTQSGYMAIIMLFIVPVFKALMLGDFSMPEDFMFFYGAILALFVIGNATDKKQEHNTSTAALTNPKTTDALITNLDKVATSVKKTETQTIQDECDKYLSTKIDAIISESMKAAIANLPKSEPQKTTIEVHADTKPAPDAFADMQNKMKSME